MANKLIKKLGKPLPKKRKSAVPKQLGKPLPKKKKKFKMTPKQLGRIQKEAKRRGW